MKLIMVFFAVVFAISAGYAGTVDERTISDIYATDDDTDAAENVEEGVQELSGKWVYPGMYPQQVQNLWGDPAYTETEYSEGIDERWTYYGLGETIIVEFDNDEVVNILRE